MESVESLTNLEETASFVCMLYRSFNAHVENDEQVLKISLDDEVAKKLDGPWARGYDLEFVFREEDLAKQESAELVTLGSYRFHYLVQLALKRGRFTKIALSERAIPRLTPPVDAQTKYYQLNSQLSYRPSLAITFVFAFQGERRWEETATFILDRTTGHVSSLSWHKLLPFVCQLSPECYARLTKATVSLKQSYRRLEQAAIEWLTTKEAGWTEAAREKLNKEQAELNEYYAKQSHEQAYKDSQAVERLHKIWQIRLNEQQERFAPKVFIRPFQFALVAVPELTTVYLRTSRWGEEKIRFWVTPFQNGFAH